MRHDDRMKSSFFCLFVFALVGCGDNVIVDEECAFSPCSANCPNRPALCDDAAVRPDAGDAGLDAADCSVNFCHPGCPNRPPICTDAAIGPDGADASGG